MILNISLVSGCWHTLLRTKDLEEPIHQLTSNTSSCGLTAFSDLFAHTLDTFDHLYSFVFSPEAPILLECGCESFGEQDNDDEAYLSDGKTQPWDFSEKQT